MSLLDGLEVLGLALITAIGCLLFFFGTIALLNKVVGTKIKKHGDKNEKTNN
jgi:hypothetical protein